METAGHNSSSISTQTQDSQVNTSADPVTPAITKVDEGIWDKIKNNGDKIVNFFFLVWIITQWALREFASEHAFTAIFGHISAYVAMLAPIIYAGYSIYSQKTDTIGLGDLMTSGNMVMCGLGAVMLPAIWDLICFYRGNFCLQDDATDENIYLVLGGHGTLIAMAFLAILCQRLASSKEVSIYYLGLMATAFLVITGAGVYQTFVDIDSSITLKAAFIGCAGVLALLMMINFGEMKKTTDTDGSLNVWGMCAIGASVLIAITIVVGFVMGLEYHNLSDVEREVISPHHNEEEEDAEEEE